jgi:hypothetical protein
MHLLGWTSHSHCHFAACLEPGTGAHNEPLNTDAPKSGDIRPLLRAALLEAW